MPVMEVFASFKELESFLVQIPDTIRNVDYTPTFQEVFLPRFEKEAQESFSRQASPKGEPWPPWQWTTYPVFLTQNFHPTLVVSGKLRGSLKRGGTGNISVVTPQEVAFGSNVVYAVIHLFGATIQSTGVPLIHKSGRGWLPIGSRINIPARPFMGFTEEMLEDFTTALTDRALEVAKEKL